MEADHVASGAQCAASACIADDHLAAFHGWLEDFQGDAASHGRRLFGEVDDGKSAFADAFLEGVGADPVAGWFASKFLFRRKAFWAEETAGLLVRLEQSRNAFKEGGVVRARLIKEGVAIWAGRKIEHLLEQFAFAVGVGGHGAG